MRTLAIVAATLLLSTAAFAQSTTSQKNPRSPQAQQNPAVNPPQTNLGSQVTAQIAQKIRSNLEQAGFKNIKLMPSSFIVRAEDHDNNTVVMVINPSSVEAITEQGSGNPSASPGTVGQGAGTTSDSDNSTGAKEPRR
jgi:hypothetical protein